MDKFIVIIGAYSLVATSEDNNSRKSKLDMKNSNIQIWLAKHM